MDAITAPAPVEKKSQTATIKTVEVLVRIEINTETGDPFVAGFFETRLTDANGVTLGVTSRRGVRRYFKEIDKATGIQTAIATLNSAITTWA